MAHLLLGIDVGTSLTKAALFDRDGREVARAAAATEGRRTHPGWSEAAPAGGWAAAGGGVGGAAAATEVRRPHPGWSEADPEAVWSALAGLIQQLLSENSVASR